MHIRRASTADIKYVKQLDRTIFCKPYGDDPADLSNAAWWLVWDGDRPVAYAGLGHWPHLPAYSDIAYLRRCGVLKAYRGRQLQRRLIDVRVRAARRLGLSRAVTYTSYENAASANNLIAAGFRMARAVPGLPTEMMCWQKPLLDVREVEIELLCG